MSEKINIFKCPYWDECYNKNAQNFYFNADSFIAEIKPCLHPFLTLKGEIICGLEMENDGNYNKIVKQIQLYKPTLKRRLREWLHTRKTKR